jgi:RNA polymerase sigma factor (sigma-70 family)
MDDSQVDDLLRQLRSREPRKAWARFLEKCSPLLLEVVRLFERDEDAAGNCYLFVCERLCRDKFRCLRRFRVEGPASFQTWLRAVVRNLCLDWHRQEFGRHRVFESVGRLSALDQEIFQAIFVECLPVEEAYLKIGPGVPGLTVGLLREGIGRVEQALTSRQRWLLSVRRARAAHNLAGRTPDDEELLQQMPSEALNPESWAALQEARTALLAALARLSPRERLVVRLRFERDLTLEEIAKLLRLENAQSADRRIREVLEKLREQMT